MNEFHFLRPEWLFALIPWLILCLLLFRQKQQAGNWQRICDADLLPHLFHDDSHQTQSHVAIWAGFAGLLICLAMAGPVWEKREQPVFEQASTLVIALDLSRSMNATDIKPSRLTRAKLKLIDLLHLRQEGQTALIVYAADAYVVTPLSTDNETIISQLEYLTTDIMPSQGSRTDIALAKAYGLIKQAGAKKGHILLITDGLSDNPMNDIPPDIQISVLGMGSKQGAPIPSGASGFILDDQGEIVISKLPSVALQQLSLKGHGQYQHFTDTSRDIDNLNRLFTSHSMDTSALVETETADQWREAGPWLIVLLLPFAALMFRRGILIIAFVSLSLMQDPVYAQNYLWQTPDQTAQALMQSGDPAAASQHFQHPEWKASAAYQAGDYQTAIDSLDGINNANAHYNRGNAYAKQDQFEQAIQAYQQAIDSDPHHEDAKANLQSVEQWVKQQDQAQQKEDDNKEKKTEDNQDGDQQDQEPQGDESSDGSEQDQQEGQKSETSDKDTSSPQDNKSDPQDDKAASKNASEEDSPKEEAEAKQSETTDSEENSAEKEAAAAETAKEKTDDEAANQPTSADQPQPEMTDNEREKYQLKQQLLRKIPDNPGELWRRKFEYQYKRQRNQRQEIEAW